MRHAEVAADALLGAAALAVRDKENFVRAEPCHAAGYGLVIAKGAIPVNLAEIRKDSLDEVHGIRPLGMACPLDSAPGGRDWLRRLGTCCRVFSHPHLMRHLREPASKVLAGRTRVILRVWGACDKSPTETALPCARGLRSKSPIVYFP